MKKEVMALKMMFKNGETWTINKEFIGDLWIKHISRSFGRIGDSDFQEIFPCESLKIEIFPEADEVNSNDINLGGLEMGMFERVAKDPDIEKMDILYTDTENENSVDIVAKETVYFPYEAKDSDRIDNVYQSSFVSKENKLYIVIDKDKTAKEIYKEKF
ncbi:hypothetical protein [Carnobacterium jeotgali]|uniref:hypothetical protein n=1 Tax=Carnobacterium jeotgali TaxID=545534 RepID=UPI00388F62C7